MTSYTLTIEGLADEAIGRELFRFIAESKPPFTMVLRSHTDEGSGITSADVVRYEPTMSDKDGE